MHDAQWQAEGRLGHFGDWPGAESFNRDLVAELSPLARVRFVRLWANDRVICSQFCFVFGDSCYWRLPARAPEPEWERFSLGRIGLMNMIEAMIGEGVRRVEGGAGHYEYKLQCGGRELPVRS